VTRQPVEGSLPLRRAAERALELARGVAGTTAPNPPVGCVLVRDGIVVGEGATEPVGGAHAEVVALRAAGRLAQGASAVVTLEPCAHTGRTPPCTDALIAAGVAEVWHLVADPNPLASGGAALLAGAGIDAGSIVRLDAGLADLVVRAEHDLRGFLALVHLGRPHALLKLAQLADGRMSDSGSSERYLTGAAARRRVHELRADVDAVMVGSGTIISDDPRLDVRDAVTSRQPRPVVLATEGRLPLGARVLARGALVLVGEGCPDRDADALTAAGAQVQRVPTVTTPDGARIDLRVALAALPELGILTVLAEPGPTLARALIAADVVDDIELHVAGSGPADALTPAVLLDAQRYETVDVRAVGADLLVRARRRSSAAAPAVSRARAVA
jgi:diaminohydroxyphosphoribosylaminopyrimidine deaminase/5-amino-6-(5-phosphoribosylamino)uracil reductase